MNDIVMVIDDEPYVRETFRDVIDDANMEALVQEEPIDSLDKLIKYISNINPFGVIIDNHLSHKNYANFTGIDVIKQLYKLGIPFIFVTTFSHADADLIKLNKQYIPEIVKSETLLPNIIRPKLKYCERDLKGIYTPERKPWRTLVRIVEVNRTENVIYVIVPNWDLNEKVRLPLSGLNFSEQHLTLLKPDTRFFAKVNIDAEDYDDLYFKDFEPPKPLKKKYADLIYS